MVRKAPAARKVRRLDRRTPERSKKTLKELNLKLDNQMVRAKKLMEDTASVQPRGQFIKSTNALGKLLSQMGKRPKKQKDIIYDEEKKSEEVDCPHCAGKGKMSMSMGLSHGNIPCRNCGGKGKGTEFKYTDTEGNMKDIKRSEEKEQAMDQEEDLEELTDGELEEVEKRFEGIKRKLRGVKNFVNEQYEKDHPLETPKLTDGGAEVLAEAESKVDDKKRLESREQQSMYKSNKVPKKVRPESPNIENDYQTQLDKPIQWKALEEKTRKVKKTINQQAARKQKPRKDNTENPMTSTTNLPKTHNNLAYGMTEPENKEDTDLRRKVKLPRRGSLPKDGQKSPLKLTPQQTKQMSDKLTHAMFHDKPEFKRLVAEPDGEKPEPDVATKEPPKKEIPEEYPVWKKRVMRGDPNSRYWRDLASSRPLAWESWLQKNKESERDKRIATRLNEMRAVTEGKVKPPTPKHLVKPSWKAWLEKDQGQGDARYGNPHETGMDDAHKLQTTRDDFSLENHDEDKKDEDNKPYKEREREERYE